MTFDDYQSKMMQLVPPREDQPSEESKEKAREQLRNILKGATLMCNDLRFNMSDIAKDIIEGLKNANV